jgi:5'-3' exoribonuclease 1
MGVPGFYGWLSQKYPLINEMISTGMTPTEFDNLYLDMNGIIHQCSHPNDEKISSDTIPLTFKEMIENIFEYLTYIVSEVVKPKRLLFLAIDGVAPRAKLNQQRSRRFRAAQERLENLNVKRKQGSLLSLFSYFFFVLTSLFFD